ncbi:MAG: class I SAM-dependent methyltransferase [Asgard group archaeon]|nr:class I SAM-dependent methyltransferase [Asgard group archaeon]
MKIMKIYTDYAKVYHEMYQSIFDYEADFELYHNSLSKLKCKKILEIGCGSGNLANFFVKKGYDYTGLDMSKEMIDLAKELVPDGKFIRADMRHLNLEECFEAVIVTGRTFTHLTTNHDVMFALSSIHKILEKDGWLLFDNFDAYEIFTGFKEEMTHKSNYNNKTYTRKSKTSFDFEHGWTWRWKALYEIEEDGKKDTFEDDIMLRAFTEDELKLFLRLNGFKTCKMEKESNAIFTIAQKINEERTNAQKLYFKQKENNYIKL